MIQISRRHLLQLGTAVVVVGVAGCTPPSPSAPKATFADWLQRRRAPYLIAHRGAGTTAPEHSLPGYLLALAWGAEAMEISVVQSSDGVLYCHHDLTLDRTTTLTGKTADADSATFDAGRIRVPRLGPRWSGDRMPAIPRLDAVLDAVGGQAVLMMEAKDDRAYPAMLSMLTQRGLLDQIMVKANYDSSRIVQAKRAGLPVFAYLGNGTVATPVNIDGLAPKLDPASDAIVLPIRDEQGARLSDTVLRHGVATGVSTWAVAAHRRSDVDLLAGVGVTGFVTPALGYLSGRLPPATEDTFAGGALAPGLTTRDPYDDKYGLGWSVPDAVGLAADDQDGARFVCLGDLCPIGGADTRYRVELDVALVSGTMAAGDAFVLAFGCSDDSYATETAGGYQAWLHGDGTTELFVVTTGGSLYRIAHGASTGGPVTSVWNGITLGVAGDTITISIGQDVALSATDVTWRGPYLHVGRNQGTARLAVRHVAIGVGE